MLPLVPARWAEVEGNGCGSGTVPQRGLNRPEQTSLLQISDPFEDIPGCFRTGLTVARPLADFCGAQRS